MFAILKALEDACHKELCFATKEDAERFKKFVNTYMDESGAGNGYGAYWVLFDAVILSGDEVPEGATRVLNRQLLEKMRNNIVKARTIGAKDGGNFAIKIGLENKALTFNPEDLPPRQRPQVGDMFRGLRSLGASKIDGRVIKDNGKTLTVISWHHENDDGTPKDNAEFIELEVEQVMKIPDWKSK